MEWPDTRLGVVRSVYTVSTNYKRYTPPTLGPGSGSNGVTGVRATTTYILHLSKTLRHYQNLRAKNKYLFGGMWHSYIALETLEWITSRQWLFWDFFFWHINCELCVKWGLACMLAIIIKGNKYILKCKMINAPKDIQI